MHDTKQQAKAPQAFLAVLAACALAVALLPVVQTPAYAADTTSTVGLTVTYGQTEARKMLERINSFRTGGQAWYWNEDDTTKTEIAAGDLGALTYDYGLEREAMQRAAEIALYYAHQLPSDGKSLSYSRLGSFNAWAENIAVGYSSEEAVFVGWREDNDMYSGQGHRRNMLTSACAYIGIGHAVYKGIHCWTQVFSNPAQDLTAVDADDSMRSVSIDVGNSLISNKGVTASPSAMSLKSGENAALPTITSTLMTAKTWSPFAPVTVTAQRSSWSTDNNEVARVEDGKLVAVGAGTTTLRATVALGGSVAVEVPVTVSKDEDSASDPDPDPDPDPNSDPDPEPGSDPDPDPTPDPSPDPDPGKDQKTDIAQVHVNMPGSVTYTGSSIAPVPSVSLNGVTLVPNTDYTVSYANNINAGNARVVINGTGAYEGSVAKTFVIKKASIGKATFSKIKTQKYKKKGKAIKPSLTVKFGGKKLAKGSAYTISYKNNKKRGTAKVIVTGKGNFAGSKTIKFKIK